MGSRKRIVKSVEDKGCRTIYGHLALMYFARTTGARYPFNLCNVLYVLKINNFFYRCYKNKKEKKRGQGMSMKSENK